jgi:putative membrane protein
METKNLNFISAIGRTILGKRSGAVLLSAFFLFGIAACDKNDDPILDTVNQQDRNFAVSSSKFVNAQIAMGNLAMIKGQDDSVLKFAKLITDENNASKTELNAILQSKEIAGSESITDEAQAKYNELALLEGQAFDKAFISYQLSGLDSSKSLFENEVDNGENFTLKGYATKTLDLVKSHRNKALLVKVEIGLEDL